MYKIQNGGGHKGFTLVELIVVIVILGVLVGVTIGGIFKYVDLARRNRDIAVIEQINRSAQALCASIDVNGLSKEFDRHHHYNGTCWVDFYIGKTKDNVSVNDWANFIEPNFACHPSKHPLVWDILEDLFPEYLPKLKYYSCEIFVGLTKNGDLFVRTYPFDKDNYIFIIDNEPISGNDLVNYINSISKIVK